MVLYSKFIAKAIPNKMHTGNNPKIMYMLFFITYYSAKTLNRYKNNIYMYMKTKRNKKQKNRSFRKKRSFKKKELKKTPQEKTWVGISWALKLVNGTFYHQIIMEHLG